VTPLVYSAPAKVNLTLEVTGRLPGGYHELDTVFSWLDLEDRLEVRVAEATHLVLEDEIGCRDQVCANEDNLVLRALRRLEVYTQRELPTHLRLVKRIPAGAGLGGGSADAAATLLGVVQAHGLPLSEVELVSLATQLGADVTFGLRGGTARGRGRGELLSPLPPPPDLTVLLLVPPFAMATPEVYRRWDALPEDRRQPARGCTARLVAALQDGDSQALQGSLGNDLSPAAEDLRPELGDLRRRMLQAGCSAAMLTGSGSTLFGLLPPELDPAPVAARLQGLGRVLCTRFRRTPR